MKPASFDYHRAASTAETLDLLSRLDDAILLAGGQSLVPMLNLRMVSPANLIDISAVGELDFIELRGQDVVIGAATTQRSIETSAAIQGAIPLLANAVRHIGHPQIRNRGTAGGSLCHLDPAAQIPLVAMALDAMVTVARQGESRSLPFSEFALGSMDTALEPGEMLTEFSLRPWPREAGWGYAQFARRHGDFCILSAAVTLQSDDAGRIQRLSVCLGGAEERPARLRGLEAQLVGEPVLSDAREAFREACLGLDLLEDAFVPGWYRAQIAPVMIERAFAEAVSRLGGGTS